MILKKWHTFMVMLLTSGMCVAQSFDTPGKSEVLPDDPGEHWLWVSSGVGTSGGKISLMDVSNDHFLGMVSVSGLIAPTFSHDNRYIYLSETFRSRNTRGERTDVLTVFDSRDLKPVEEIIIPPRKASMLSSTGAAALSDDGRFLAIFDLTPATSVSILDMENRAFIEEITTPGCSLIFTAGDRR